MSSINSNIPSLRAQVQLNFNQRDLNVRLARLASGLRINRGADDPAGLIVSQRLRSELAAVDQAMDNSERADSVLGVAEGALNEVSALLNELQGLVTSSANTSGLSQEEIDANQLQIDAIIASIDRISSVTEFAGQKLLDGTLQYTLSGHNTTQLSDVSVFTSRLPDVGSVNVVVEVTNSAEQARVVYNRGTATPLTSGMSFELSGNLGVELLSFASGTALSAMVATVNDQTHLTGVTAALSGTSAVVFTSSKFGSDQFVSIRQLTGTMITTPELVTKDTGVDVGAIINGQVAGGRGLEATVRTNSLDVELLLSQSFAQQTTSTSTFTITGGGAVFQITPLLNSQGRVYLGIPSTRTTNIGNSVDGYLYTLQSGGVNEVSGGNFATAEKILDNAITQVSELRGRIGSIQKDVIETNLNSLQVAMENLTAAEITVREADLAEEISKLTRSQILVQSSIQVLTIANQLPANVLQLLGGS